MEQISTRKYLEENIIKYEEKTGETIELYNENFTFIENLLNSFAELKISELEAKIKGLKTHVSNEFSKTIKENNQKSAFCRKHNFNLEYQKFNEITKHLAKLEYRVGNHFDKLYR